MQRLSHGKRIWNCRNAYEISASAQRSNGLLIALGGCCLLVSAAVAGTEEPSLPATPIHPSLRALQSAVVAQGRVIQSFRVEGVVCAVVPERRMAVLQDETATVLL